MLRLKEIPFPFYYQTNKYIAFYRFFLLLNLEIPCRQILITNPFHMRFFHYNIFLLTVNLLMYFIKFFMFCNFFWTSWSQKIFVLIHYFLLLWRFQNLNLSKNGMQRKQKLSGFRIRFIWSLTFGREINENITSVNVPYPFQRAKFTLDPYFFATIAVSAMPTLVSSWHSHCHSHICSRKRAIKAILAAYFFANFLLLNGLQRNFLKTPSPFLPPP